MQRSLATSLAGLLADEAAFRIVADAMPVLVWLADARGKNVYCNRAYLEFRGTSLEEEREGGWLNAIHPADRSGYMDAARAAFRQQTPFELEARFLAASGDYRWLLCRGQPVTDESGAFAGYLGTSNDISPRKASEEAATIAAARFRALTDTVPNIVWSAGPGGAIEFVNARWREYSGISADRARSAYWIDFVHPDDRDEAMAAWLASVRTGTSYSCEYRLRRHDGMYRWHMVQACPVRDGDGRIVEWSGVCTDVHAMRVVNTRMRMLADALPQMVSVSATDGSVMYFNQRWHEYTGLDFEQTEGWGWMQALHPDDVEGATLRWRPALEDGKTLEVEVRFRRADGTYRWHILRAVPIREGDGTLVAWFATATDIEELRYQQTRWQAIADSVSEMIWTAAPDGKVTFANARVAQYTGVPVETLISTDWDDFVHAQDSAVAVQGYFRAVREGLPFEFECRLRRFDGEYRWHLARGRPLRDSAGTLMGWVGSSMDVHDLHSEKLGSRVISDAIPALVFTAGTDGRVEYANRRAGDYLGRSTIDLLSHGWGESIHPGDRWRSGRLYRSALRSGTLYECELRLRSARGQYSWHMVRALPLRDSLGRPTAWFGTATDIEGQKTAEERVGELNAELQRRLSTLETLLRVLPIGVGIASSPNLHEIRLNAAMADMLGDPKAVGHAVRDPQAPQPFTFLKRDQPVTRAEMPMERAVRDRAQVTEELDLERADGTRINLLEFAAPLMEGDEVRGAVAAMVDVTAVRQAQAEATRAEASLAAAGGSVPFGIWTADVEGQLTSVSDSYCEMLGEAPGEVMGGQWLNHLAPQWRELAQFDWLECVRARRPWDYEHELLGSDGQWHTVLQRGRPLVDEGGVFHGYAGINLDISDLKKMQRDLSLTVDQLRRANEVKDELLGLVSHELRTPLTTIFGNAEALRRHYWKIKTPDRVQALRDIEDDAARLQRLIENMLVLARVEGPDPGTAEPLLLQRLLPRIATEAAARGVRNTVTVDVPPDLPAVSAQQTYVEQVVGNLVGNAAKYSGPERPIELSARIEDDSVSVLVQDRGSGITQQEAERIFAPFYRLERTAEQAGGIGLGLAVCKRLIETQGGRIWAEPRAGGGTTIGFTLPIEQEYERDLREDIETDG